MPYPPPPPTTDSIAAGGPRRPGIQLSSVQHDFYESKARFSLFIGGIGSGKTTAGAVRAINCAIDQPGGLGLVGAPTYTMLHDTTQRIFFELLPPSNIRSFSKTDQRLLLTTGSEILFRSLDEPDRVRGLNLAWFWLDEATLCGHYAWKILKGRLRQRGYDTAGWATATPRGRDGYYEDFEHAPYSSHALYRASTHTNLPNLPPGFLDELGYTGAFADQEIAGHFTAFEGLVYTFDASDGGNLRAPDPDTHWADVIGGVDWGYSNPAAAVVFGLDGDGRAWQLDEFYRRRAPLDGDLIPALLDLTRRYGVRTWYCGPDEPEHITALNAALSRAGLPARALRGDNAVRPGVQTVTAQLAPRDDGTRGLYVPPGCVHTIAEYGAYQYPTADSTRRDPSEQPLKHSDHALDATRYALHTHLTQARRVAGYLVDMARRNALAAAPPELPPSTG